MPYHCQFTDRAAADWFDNLCWRTSVMYVRVSPLEVTAYALESWVDWAMQLANAHEPAFPQP